MFKVLIVCYLALLKLSLAWPERQTRIVGGLPTNISQVPYIVQLWYYNRFCCSGTLVSESFVVTAAHCVKDRRIRYLTIIAGATYLYQRGKMSEIDQIVLPKLYIQPKNGFDVAVLKLRSPVKGDGIRPIELCTKAWKPGAAVHVSGWGQLNEKLTKLPKQLRTVTVKVIQKSTCSYMYRRYAKLTNSMFCASVIGQKGACFGDSGGPAIINGQFCGMVSYGRGCSKRGFPNVYTNILAMHKFIKGAMR